MYIAGSSVACAGFSYGQSRAKLAVQLFGAAMRESGMRETGMRETGAMPLSVAVGEALKAKIIGGVYPPGARVPSTRSLAAELGVSRTTVTVAYEKLLAEGYLETRAGSSTFVPAGFRPAPAPVAPAHPAAAPPLAQYGARALALAAAAPLPVLPAPRIDFRYGAVAASDFPALAWRRAITNVPAPRDERLRYGDPAGTPELRAALQAYLWRARGLRCEAGQVIVVNGTQQGLDLCARLLLDPGDRVVVENPCYGLARDSFAAAGAVTLPVAVDAEGMQTGRLAALAPARLAFVTPSHQFPLGAIMPVSRRRDLLGWAELVGGYVIEDDYDSEFRYQGRPIETLRMLDTADRVIYIGTLSKTLSPGLRLGYVVAPRALQAGFVALKRLADRQSPDLLQQAVAAMIGDGSYERHVRRLRGLHAARRTALLRALDRHFGARISVVGAAAGLHVVVWFHDVPLHAEAALVAAAAAGVGIYPIGPHWDPRQPRTAPPCAGAILGYASLAEAQMQAGTARLATAVDRVAKTGE
jgi:GntR family transcriptional regulator/MocR family aminotransferase